MFDRINEGRWWDFGWQLIEGCTPVSAACDNCWSLAKEKRFRKETGVIFHEERLERPTKRKKPASYAIWNDLFHEDVSFEWIDKVVAIIAMCPQHTFQVLTKRPERMREYFISWNLPFRIAKQIDVLTSHRKEGKFKCEIVPISDYPGYYISNEGEVFSGNGSSICVNCGKDIPGFAKSKFCSKKCKSHAEYIFKRDGKYPVSPKLNKMKFDKGKQGHCRVMFYKNGKQHRELVHRLVLTEFDRRPIADEQTCHADGNPLNNHIANLRWGTQEDNWKDRKRHGNGRSYSKLSVKDVDDILKMRKSGNTLTEIACRFNVSDVQIGNIVNNKHWNYASDLKIPIENMMLGVTAENQEQVNKRIPILLQTPAAKRFVSIEPMLSAIDLTDIDAEMAGHEEYIHINSLTGHHTDMGRPCNPVNKLDWILCGSESGPGRRECSEHWVRSLRDQCVEAKVPFFLKQLHRNGKKVAIPELDGQIYNQIAIS